MKKFLLTGLFIVFISVSVAQNRAFLSKEYACISAEATYGASTDRVVFMDAWKTPGMKSRGIAPGETEIGLTLYDLQTNKMLSDRLYRFEDGTFGFVWTMGLQDATFPDRGTGYNYYDGTGWGPAPDERIEGVRTGWPSYAPLGESGEIVISHDFGEHTLNYYTRAVKGTGDWAGTTYTYGEGPDALAWARLVTSGPDHNQVHLLANSFEEYQGMTTAVVYSRSTDGAQTWDIENALIEGMDSDYYTEISADEYVWAEPKNGTIAFLCAGAWHDMFMMKSTDNGENWEKTVIWEHPYPFFDWNTTIADTFFCVDNSASITLDNDGKAHVVFGISRVMHEDLGTTYQYFPFVDGIGYWNEDMDPFSDDHNALAPPQYGYGNSEMIEDVNYIGYMQDVDGDGEIHLAGWPNTTIDNIMSYRELGPSTMPTVHVDENGFRYLLFASTTETYVNDQVNYKHIWARTYADGTWGEFHDLTSDITHIFDECIYPLLAETSDDHIYYTYNADVTPGLALDEEHGYQDNRLIFAELSKSDLIIFYGTGDQPGANTFELSGPMPNPCRDEFSFAVNTTQQDDLILGIMNPAGQIIFEKPLESASMGKNLYRVDVSGLQPGMYFYTVTGGNGKVSKKLIIE